MDAEQQKEGGEAAARQSEAGAAIEAGPSANTSNYAPENTEALAGADGRPNATPEAKTTSTGSAGLFGDLSPVHESTEHDVNRARPMVLDEKMENAEHTQPETAATATRQEQHERSQPVADTMPVQTAEPVHKDSILHGLPAFDESTEKQQHGQPTQDHDYAQAGPSTQFYQEQPQQNYRSTDNDSSYMGPQLATEQDLVPDVRLHRVPKRQRRRRFTRKSLTHMYVRANRTLTRPTLRWAAIRERLPFHCPIYRPLRRASRAELG